RVAPRDRPRPGADRHLPDLARLRARAQGRLRPRVRTAAARRHGAGPRTAPPAADTRVWLARVHPHALRPDPAPLPQVEAGHDRARLLGRDEETAGRRPRALSR